MPGAAEALAAVAARVPVAVATTKPRAFAEPLCERLGLAPSLTAVCGPELDAPEEVKTVTVRRALEALGVAPGDDTPLVGDRSHDVEAARANGMPCVGVLWGIGDEAELRAAGASPIVAAPADLAARSGSRASAGGEGRPLGVGLSASLGADSVHDPGGIGCCGRSVSVVCAEMVRAVSRRGCFCARGCAVSWRLE